MIKKRTLLVQKIGSAIAGAALLGSLLTPAVFASSVDIVDNGANSKNNVEITNICNASLVQKNKTDAKTNVNVVGNSGSNNANGNTGGDVTVDTGNVTSNVTVTVGGASNEGTMPDCCECLDTSLAVTIGNNGAGSDNKVKSTNSVTTSAKQKNKTKVRTRASLKGKTGKNNANGNTGGTTEVKTGDVESTVDVTVDAPSNIL